MNNLLNSFPLIALMGALGFTASLWADEPRDPAPREKPTERAEPKKPREQLDRILELKKEIDEAMRGNDPQKMIELVGKLQQLMFLERGGGAFQFQFQPRGAEREQPKSDLRLQYEKQLKEFADSIEKLKDDKEAREAIEKARDEYKKAMEAELKKADAERPVVPRRAEIQPFQPLIPFPQLDFGRPRIGRDDARLGVQLERPSAVIIEQLDLPANTGLVIADVLRGMPAEKAGFKKNDILLQWAGKDLPSEVEGFQALVAAAKAGEKFEAVVLRKGKKETIKGIELTGGKRDAGAINQIQVQINGTVGEIQATSGGVKYELTVEMEGRRAQASKIVITDGEEKSKYESVEKVPEKYRPTVEKLIGKIHGFE